MDYEDTSRVLDQLWEQDPTLFMVWLKHNHAKVLEYLSKEDKS